jgi:hypothetical protein
VVRRWGTGPCPPHFLRELELHLAAVRFLQPEQAIIKVVPSQAGKLVVKLNLVEHLPINRALKRIIQRMLL